jgi:hypothetical protein
MNRDKKNLELAWSDKVLLLFFVLFSACWFYASPWVSQKILVSYERGRCEKQERTNNGVNKT